ncbi:MAG TPA: FAD-dependent oxidoreductase [Spirillospora sp.]
MIDQEMSDALVVGGGIGGLAAALALARAGHSVRLLEQAPEFGEVGAGLQLAPNATRILAEWELLDAVIGAGGVLPRRLVLRDAISGAELTHLDLGDGFRERYGAPYVVMHRSDLHTILLEACARAGVDLTTGSHVRRVDGHEHFAAVHCADGRTYRSRAVIAADGLHSTLRGSIVDDDVVTSGHVAYRGTLPADTVASDVSMDEVVAWIGPDCHLVQYPLRHGDLVNQVAVFRSPAFERGEPEWGLPEELDAAFSRCCATVRSALSGLWRDRRWPMYDRLPADRWVRGRLALLGDAAHPMLQYLAQGACQAIEDAHAMAAEVSKNTTIQQDDTVRVDWEAALDGYQNARRSRAGRVQSVARTWGEIWHLDGTARLVRNELLTTRRPDDFTHIDWLYSA